MKDTSLPRLNLAHASVWLRGSYFWYFAGIGCFGPYIALYYRLLHLEGWQIGVLAAILPVGIAFIAPLWGAFADTYSAHRLVLRATLLLAAGTVFALAWATSFVVLLPLMLLLATCLAAIPAFLDGYAVTIAERENLSFGQLRVWGSLGYIASVWLVGRLLGQSISNTFLFAYVVALLLTCAATLGLPPLQARSAQPVWHGVSTILRDRSMLLLLLMVYLVNSNITVINSYFSIYLSDIGAGVGLISLASVISAMTELPMLVLGRRLLVRFTSRQILIFSVGMYLLRFVLYSIPTPLPWILAVQLLHGLSFGLYLMSSVTLVHEMAGRERAATAQSLLNSTSVGFGAITGSIVGGLLLDRIGALGVFRVAAVGMIISLGVCVLVLRRPTRTE